MLPYKIDSEIRKKVLPIKKITAINEITLQRVLDIAQKYLIPDDFLRIIVGKYF